VELRRVLLLFAIVLGVAAVITSVSQPRNPGGERDAAPAGPPSTPRAEPGPGAPPRAELEIEDGARPALERLEIGRPATLSVKVREPGFVEIPSLGLSGFGEPLTPARFEILAREQGSHTVRFTPSGQSESRTIGTLRIEAGKPGRGVR
jgi:hypothetical protein